jgi:hypothetical protein
MNGWLKHDLTGTANRERALYELKVAPNVMAVYAHPPVPKDKPVMHIVFDKPDGKRMWFEIHSDQRAVIANFTESQLLEWCLANRNGFSEYKPTKP